jgi:hypothetical protein
MLGELRFKTCLSGIFDDQELEALDPSEWRLCRDFRVSRLA